MIETGDIAAYLPWHELVDALDAALRAPYACPVRHHHDIPVPADDTATLLLMPAWIEGRYLGVKQVTVFPGNARRNRPALSGHYLLRCARTGEPLAQFDGDVLTAKRTAAASALGTRYLSRPDSRRLLMLGSGRVAREVVPATRSVRDLRHVDIWSPTPEHAEHFAADLREGGLEARAVADDALAEAAGRADIISAATLSRTPVLHGAWVGPGTHVDLIGSFRPGMREADDALMSKAHVFVDFREAALAESGDLIAPLESGALTEDALCADLVELSRHEHAGRPGLDAPNTAITLFKAVGASIEDLAAAALAYEKLVDIQAPNP